MLEQFEPVRQSLIQLGIAMRTTYGSDMYGQEGEGNPSNLLDQVLGRLNHVEGAVLHVDRIHRVVLGGDHDREDLLSVAFDIGVIEDMDTCDTSDADLRNMIREYYV